MNNSQKRIEYIDLYRSIGIILMVLGHIGFGSFFDKYIHAFHMPMFFFCSGLFFNSNREFLFFLQKKIKSLIFPFILYLIFYYILDKISFKECTASFIHIILYINRGELQYATPIWFLLALFFADLIYYVITKIKREIIRNLIVVLFAILGHCLHLIISPPCILSIDAAFIGVGIIHIASNIKKSKYSYILDKLSCMQIIIFSIIISILIVFNQKINMRCGSYGIIPLFWVNSIIASILLLNLSNKLYNLKYLNIRCKLLISILCNIGRWSLIFLCLNFGVILLIYKYIPYHGENKVLLLLQNCMVFLISMIIMYSISSSYNYLKKKIIYVF